MVQKWNLTQRMTRSERRKELVWKMVGGVLFAALTYVVCVLFLLY